MNYIAPMLVMITGLLVFGGVIRALLVNRRLREESRSRLELHARMIDRFGTAEEIVRYLESDAGSKLLSGGGANAAEPRRRVLDSLHLGLLVLAGSVGLLVARGVSDPVVSEAMRSFGLVGILLGAGFLASAALTWKLGESWRGGSPGETGTELG